MTVVMVALALIVPTNARGGEAFSVRGGHAKQVVIQVPHLSDWECIHSHEARWNDAGDPYWGGLQMDRNFMATWGADMERKYGGFANLWSPRDQMIVAERAREARGWTPWPETSRMCGL